MTLDLDVQPDRFGPSGRRVRARMVGVLALVCVAGLILAVLSRAAGSDDTVTVTQDGFTLRCDAEAVEGETMACTLTNTSADAQPWPVVALLHLSADEDRALVVGSPVDVAFGSLSPAVELDSSVWWIGETLVGYSRFDWDGEADGTPADPPPPPDCARSPRTLPDGEHHGQ
ncbi:hypothetical protein [Candidatus Poriferisodalis sp.]|uniref:hypothetical protein n=1 Tax=Candidatus Poriferisodalis sp. TaxID=3101277 RepID=UPI003B024816